MMKRYDLVDLGIIRFIGGTLLVLIAIMVGVIRTLT